MLNQMQMKTLLKAIRDEISSEKLEEIIVNLDNSGKLSELMNLMGLKDCFQEELVYHPNHNQKVVVLGDAMTKVNHLIGIAKQYGLNKNHFEFCLGYEKAKTYQYNKFRNSNKYAAIIVGPIPHSTTGTGSYSSAIAAMESDDEYPPVFRVEKITNSSFRSVITQLISKKVIVA